MWIIYLVMNKNLTLSVIDAHFLFFKVYSNSCISLSILIFCLLILPFIAFASFSFCNSVLSSSSLLIISLCYWFWIFAGCCTIWLGLIFSPLLDPLYLANSPRLLSPPSSFCVTPVLGILDGSYWDFVWMRETSCSCSCKYPIGNSSICLLELTFNILFSC